jgi:hypothetical protein
MGDGCNSDRLKCTCMALSAHALLAKWLVRLERVVRRRLLRGRGIDPKRAGDVAILITRLEQGPDRCPEAWDDLLASCHMPGCPWRRGKRC